MSPKDTECSSAAILTIWARCASVSWWSFTCLGSIYPPEKSHYPLAAFVARKSDGFREYWSSRKLAETVPPTPALSRSRLLFYRVAKFGKSPSYLPFLWRRKIGTFTLLTAFFTAFRN